MLSVLLRFVFLGPFAGGGIFLAVRNLAATSAFVGVTEIAIMLVLVLPMAVLALFLAIPLGFIPAITTGIFYWYILARMKRNPTPLLRVIFGGSIGLLASIVFGLLFSFSEAPGAFQPAVNLLSWACAGAIAGGLSALTIGDTTYAIAFERRKA